jgi:trehalose synthase
MMQLIDLEPRWTLDDYGAVPSLAGPVRTLRAEASLLVSTLKDRTVWMVNSTARGGGVAEMLPRMVTLLSELGLSARWVVMKTDREEFFRLTKRLHNLVHGQDEPAPTEDDRRIYEEVNQETAEQLRSHLKSGDILVVHDPQPMALAGFLRETLDLPAIWRCHIGHDEHLASTRAAWHFLRPYAEAYDTAVFSAPEYIPDFFAGRATIIHPALDPFSHKNRGLTPHKLVGVLCNAGLKEQRHPVLTPAFSRPVLRLRPDGTFGPVLDQEEIGMLYRPIVTQVSRWDRLKGFAPLLEAFARLKKSAQTGHADQDTRHRHRLEIVRLILAGPDPASIQDDPEGQEVLRELSEAYRRLETAIQKDVALLSLPMGSRKENALMVNALQRCSTVVVQNSLREGFGLTATEAMWKGVPVLSSRASGLRLQIRSGIDGIQTQDPEDPDEIARRLDDLLRDVPKQDHLARSARRRVHERYLIFTQLCEWVRALSTCVSVAARGRRAREK